MPNGNKESGLKQQFLNNLAEHVTENDLLNLFPNKEDYTSFLQRAFSHLLNKIMLRERDHYLANNPDSVGNGFCPPRTFRAGILPLDAYIPRTRDSFYPRSLPKYKRNLPETYEELFYSLLLEAKSFSSVRNTVRNLGLSYSQEEMDKLVDELHQEAKEFSSRPLASDWLFIFIDAKAIDLRDEAGIIKKGSHFIVTGVSMDGKKEILTTKAIFKKESLDAWRELLIDLKNRGVTRVLVISTDDFSGLANLIKSLFPQGTDHQLCTVHLQRNAYRHLSKEDYEYFRQRMKEIFNGSSFEAAHQKLLEICEKFSKKYKGFIDNMKRKAENYINFTRYPSELWGSLRTTNMPEGLNNEIEKIKRDSGGYFHTEKELMVKMRIMTIRLYKGKWKKPSPKVQSSMQELTQMFYQRFEGQSPERFK